MNKPFYWAQGISYMMRTHRIADRHGCESLVGNISQKIQSLCCKKYEPRDYFTVQEIDQGWVYEKDGI